MAYATATDVTDRWGEEITDTAVTTLITTRLGDVERMIKRRITDLDDRAEDEDYLADLIQIEADAVLRLARNPEGFLSESDGSYTYMLQQQLTTGRLEILPDEWETLGIIRSTMSVLVPNFAIPQ